MYTDSLGFRVSELLIRKYEGNMDTISRLTENYPDLSKGQKRIVDYILNHKEDAAFIPASELASKASISESVLVRFIASLGFSGYKDMQKSLVADLKNTLTVVGKFERFKGIVEDAESVYARVVNTEYENINKTIKNINIEDLEKMVDRIILAEHIGIAAVRGGTSPALVLQLFLNQLTGNVHLLTPNFLDTYDRIKDWGENDLVIGFSFRNETHFINSIMDYAKEKGCVIGAITDNRSNHIAMYADYVVQAEVKSPFVSYTAPMMLVSIISALVVQRMEERGDTFESMREIEKIINII
jgi:DNA-binding MurR/RpiR family transcriptional regulator